MDVIFTLSNLFFTHDRVVVNGLGVFTTEIEKVYIHPVEHSFSPEFKKIKFLANKNISDGLLANSLGVENADSLIDEFVKNTHIILKEGNKVQLKNIGFLYLHHTGEVILEQDRKFNYVKKNFGLQGFIQKPIVKNVPSKEPSVAAVPAKERKKMRVGAYILWSAAIILAIMAFWKMDTIRTFFNEVPGKNIAEASVKPKNIDNKPVLKETDINTSDTVTNSDTVKVTNDSIEGIANVVIDNGEEEAAVKEVEPEMVEVAVVEEKQHNRPVYYVIAGCFRSEFKANRLLEDLKTDGFEDASIEGKTPNGLIRVCYSSYPKRRQASNYMLKLQNQGRKGVWIQKSK